MPYPTGDQPISSSLIGFRVLIPDDNWIIQTFIGAIATLIQPYEFEKVGTVTPAEIANVFEDIVLESFMQTADLIGAILPYATGLEPFGALLCDGSAYQRSDYPLLYARLKSEFIVDADEFITPDIPTISVDAGGTPVDLSYYLIAI